MSKTNEKSDVKAKQAYKSELKKRGYTNINIVAAPADISAVKNNETYYFEIKMTKQKDRYFGAATLTEWEAAIKNPQHYKFVIAQTNDNLTFNFIEYTPEEFMEFSTIPPFKIYFDVNLKDRMKKRERRTAISFNKKVLGMLISLYQKLK
jgi:hypothetical protein